MSCHLGLAPALLFRINMKTKFFPGRHGFTLVEIMIVVAIIALLASIAVPGFLRARKRSQASRIMNDLRLIDNAVDMYAIENNKSGRDPVPVSEWTKYIENRDESLPSPARIFSERLTVLRLWTLCQRSQPAPIKRSRT